MPYRDLPTQQSILGRTRKDLTPLAREKGKRDVLTYRPKTDMSQDTKTKIPSMKHIKSANQEEKKNKNEVFLCAPIKFNFDKIGTFFRQHNKLEAVPLLQTPKNTKKKFENKKLKSKILCRHVNSVNCKILRVISISIYRQNPLFRKRTQYKILSVNILQVH